MRMKFFLELDMIHLKTLKLVEVMILLDLMKAQGLLKDMMMTLKIGFHQQMMDLLKISRILTAMKTLEKGHGHSSSIKMLFQEYWLVFLNLGIVYSFSAGSKLTNSSSSVLS